MNTKSRQRLGVSGFTLVELLIAFVMVALISLLLFSGLRVGIRAWGAVESAAEINTELRLTRDFLRRILSQARPVTLLVEAEPYLVFAGNRQQVEFVAPLSEQVGIPGLYLLRLGLENTGLGSTLVLKRWLLNPEVLAGGREVPAWQPLGNGPSFSGVMEDQDVAAGAYGVSLLMEGIEEFEISYFGFPEGDGTVLNIDAQPEWQAIWQNLPILPQAVRIHLTKAQRVWPDLIVELGKGVPGTEVGMGVVVPR
ncbi:MAG TPA: general secretion pathway protein GspJ [Chromatiaceae bacterium]|jgi:general secretion pathway protein J|nr:general secretion pathway protein GspJ [Chromatiaceae bacterium]